MMRNAVLGTLLLVSQFSVVLVAAYEPSPDYTTPGPCAVQNVPTTPLQLPAESGCGYHCTLDVHIHAPTAVASVTGCPVGPYPVVVFFNGFQLSSTYYTTYVSQLASWGFAVVQYDLPLLTIVADAVELGYMPYLLKHLSSQPDAQGLLDLSRLATAGHSRGGKLAALHLAGTPGVLTAYLIDPVDSTTFSPASPQNPSAVQALKGKNKLLAITGGGVSGPCSPVNSNWHVFWEVVGADSWLEMVPQAGHMQFTNISKGVVAKALDLVCKAGKTSHEHVISLTAPTMTAWMDATLRCSATTASAWGVQASQASGLLAQPHHQQQRHLSWETALPSGEYQQLRGSMTLSRHGEGASAVAVSGSSSCSLQDFFAWVRREQTAVEITFQMKQ